MNTGQRETVEGARESLIYCHSSRPSTATDEAFQPVALREVGDVDRSELPQIARKANHDAYKRTVAKKVPDYMLSGWRSIGPVPVPCSSGKLTPLPAASCKES